MSINTYDGLLDTESGPRNIPKLRFIENVEEYLVGKDLDDAIRHLHELHSKFQLMDRSLHAQKRNLMSKLPDIREALDAVNMLEKKKSHGPLKSHFVLSDNVLATAEIPPTDSVFLWLGANVLLEYPINEAREMLQTNFKNAEVGIVELNSGLEHLREQLTTAEVNIARFHNYGVGLRKAQQS